MLATESTDATEADLERSEGLLRDLLGTFDELAAIIEEAAQAGDLSAIQERNAALLGRIRAADRMSREIDPGVARAIARRLAPEVRALADRLKAASDAIAENEALQVDGLPLILTAGKALRHCERWVALEGPGPPPHAKIFMNHTYDYKYVYYTESKLRTLLDPDAGPGGVESYWGFSESGATAFLVWPVADARALAARTEIGTEGVAEDGWIVVDLLLGGPSDYDFYKQRDDDASWLAENLDEVPWPAEDPGPPASTDPAVHAAYLLGSDDPIRRRAGLIRLADDPDAISPRILGPIVDALVEDPDPGVRPHAMRVLNALDTFEARARLLTLVDAPDSTDQIEAMEILGRANAVWAVDAIADQIPIRGGEERGLERDELSRAAVEALVAIGPAAEPALIALINHPEGHTRSWALRGLTEIGGEATAQAIKAKGVADPFYAAQAQARIALEAIETRRRKFASTWRSLPRVGRWSARSTIVPHEAKTSMCSRISAVEPTAPVLSSSGEADWFEEVLICVVLW